MNPWPAEQFVHRLREVGRLNYHDRHPFHELMNHGRLTPGQVRLWVANRYYYQKNIPVKDALLVSRCPLRKVRQVWIQRIIDHDGTDQNSGGIEKWLRLAEAVGISRDALDSDHDLLPGVRFAVDAYLQFVATHSWVEGVASSLTELFAPQLMRQRLAAFEQYYPWIDRDGLDYFRSRPSIASRDSEHGLSVVLQHCDSLEQQERAVKALRFKCDVLWSQLDAIYFQCVVSDR